MSDNPYRFTVACFECSTTIGYTDSTMPLPIIICGECADELTMREVS